jgi:hypothetical protein
MRLLAGPVFFAGGFLGLFSALFAVVFEAAFFAGAAGIAGAAGGGVCADLEADKVADFLAAVLGGVLAAVLAGAGALLASADFLTGAFLLAAFLAAAAGAAEAGAGAASGFTVVADDAFACELIFSAKDFLFDPVFCGATADFAFRDVFDEAGDAEVAGAAASGASAPDSRAEIRKSLRAAPRFFKPCLSQAGFGPRPLHV